MSDIQSLYKKNLNSNCLRAPRTNNRNQEGELANRVLAAPGTEL